MTTIASDGRTVAADGLETWGHEAASLDRKKIQVVKGKIYALSGTGAYFDACIKWHIGGADPRKAPETKGENTWALSVFLPTHVEYYTDKAPYKCTYPYPFSIGSGCDYATGAMLAGAPPRRAVEIAASRNLHTGGIITVVDMAAVYDETPRRVSTAASRILKDPNASKAAKSVAASALTQK